MQLIVVDPSKRKTVMPEEPSAADASGERRRIGRIVHDDRGTAKVEWHDAPADFQRQKLEVEDGDSTIRRLAILTEGPAHPFNPYDRPPEVQRPKPPAGKRDLRKLSEWIKMMRELEERKQRGEPEE